MVDSSNVIIEPSTNKITFAATRKSQTNNVVRFERFKRLEKKIMGKQRIVYYWFMTQW